MSNIPIGALSRRNLILVVVALALLAVGVEAAVQLTTHDSSRRILWRGNTVPGHVGAHFRYFDGADGRGLQGHAGDTLQLHYTLAPEAGSLELIVVDPDGRALWTRRATGEAQGNATLDLNATGRYRIVVRGVGARGSFDVSYRSEPSAGS